MSTPLRLASITVLVLATACAPRTKPPNILFITIDTLRADHLGCYGFERPTSPEIDRFAKSACVFDAAQSAAPWTLSSLTSIMTSLSSSTHGCWQIQSRLEPEFTTLAETLRDGGYDTALVACHLFLSAQYGLQQGFTHVDDTLIRTAVDSDKAISSPGVSERGIRFLEQKAAAHEDVPWFMWLHFFDPHDEYLVHAGYSEKFGVDREIDRYDGEIAFTDHYVGLVLAKLDELGLARNTIVVITADHGEEFGEHGFMRHGNSLYQEAVHVPLIVRVPGQSPGRVGDVVSGVDLMPTLLEYAGIAARNDIEGVSLRALVEGRSVEHHNAVSEVRWHADQDLRALRCEDWKLIEDRGKRAGEKTDESPNDQMFDLAHDPHETSNLFGRAPNDQCATSAAIARRLLRALGWAKKYPVPEPYAPSPGDTLRLTKLGYTGNGDDGTSQDAQAPKKEGAK